MTQQKKNSMVWPIGIIVVYGIFMLFLFAYLAFSQSIGVDLVTDDYYAKEIAYQQQIDKMARTKILPVQPQVVPGEQAGEVTVLFDRTLSPQQLEGTILLMRPSDLHLDFTVKLQLDEDGVQKIRNLRLRKGLWKVKIDWRMDELDYYFEEVVILP